MPGTRPNWVVVIAVTTEARPAIEPTLRSISAAAITKVIATAMIEIVAVCRTMFSMLLAERNPSLPRKIANKMNTTTNAM